MNEGQPRLGAREEILLKEIEAHASIPANMVLASTCTVDMRYYETPHCKKIFPMKFYLNDSQSSVVAKNYMLYSILLFICVID